MKKLKWSDVLNNKDLSHINIIGYGSLLNRKTINDDKIYTKVTVKGYERLYNSSYIPEQLTERRKEVFKNNAKFLFEDPSLKKNQIIYKENSGTLNVIYKKDAEFNGLMHRIEKEEFKDYAKREELYYLQEVEYSFFEDSEIKNKEEAYIVIMPDENINEQPICYIYDKVCRNGAYELGVEFGLEYDKTTFYKNDLSYKYIINKYFPKGQNVKITNIMNTLVKYQGEKENLIKSHNKEAIVIGHLGSDIKLLTSDGVEIYFDFGDLS